MRSKFSEKLYFFAIYDEFYRGIGEFLNAIVEFVRRIVTIILFSKIPS